MPSHTALREPLSFRIVRLALALVLLGTALGVFAPPQPAVASSYSVSTESELRDALTALSADTGGPHHVTLNADILLTTGHVVYSGTQDLTIDGNGHEIDGNDNGRVLYFPIADGVTVTLQNLIIEHGATSGQGGYGGGIAVNSSSQQPGGDLVVVDCIIRDNFAGGNDGGGISVAYGGDLTLVGTTVIDNRAGDDTGGVMATNVEVISSTIANNLAASSSDGGGVYGETVTLINSTVSGNVARLGSGVYSRGPVQLIHATISANPGQTQIETLENFSGPADLESFGSVIAYPTSSNCAIEGDTTSAYSYDDDATCGFDEPSDISGGSDPQLGLLEDNGGSTLTQLPGFPLIDQIPSSACRLDVTADQRGVTRPHLNGCDIGAVEFDGTPPTGHSDVFVVDEDTTLTVSAPGVLGNDTDPDGDSLTATIETSPAHGTLDLEPDGSFAYTPHQDWSGTDHFTYRAYDGWLLADPAQATITVTPINDPPQVPDLDAPFIIPGQMSCVDIYGSLLNAAEDVDGDLMTAHLLTNAQYVDVVLNPDGTWCAAPAGTWPGEDTFWWRAFDGKEYSSPAKVTLTTRPMTELADLSVKKTADRDTVTVGGSVVYTITVRNDGPDPATTVTVTDELPSELLLTSAPQWCTVSARTVFCSIGTMAVGQVVTIEITAVVAAAGPITNEANANLHEIDLDGELQSAATVNAEPPAGNPFSDDDDSVFEADIAWMATMGITKGCNPPDNTMFCPDAYVTRGQMAAFLVRAMGYTDNGGGDLFSDDDTSIFENDIDRLGTAGVTKGCNPPDNTMFCPDAYVTRGQMAAFLHRALG